MHRCHREDKGLELGRESLPLHGNRHNPFYLFGLNWGLRLSSGTRVAVYEAPSYVCAATVHYVVHTRKEEQLLRLSTVNQYGYPDSTGRFGHGLRILKELAWQAPIGAHRFEEVPLALSKRCVRSGASVGRIREGYGSDRGLRRCLPQKALLQRARKNGIRAWRLLHG
jgi:hypothetical protein